MSSVAPYREPFSLDTILRFLSKVPFSPPFLVILPVLALLLERRGVPLAEVFSNLPTLAGWKELLFEKHKWFGRIMILIVLRMASRFFAVRAENNFVPKRDPPNWSKDVVVMTGGATGIGKEVVQELSRRYKAKIAVLDIAEPTYKTAPGAPEPLYIYTDVSDPKMVKAAHQQIVAHFGTSPSIVVACAGIVTGGTLMQVSPASVDRTFNINSLSNVILTQEFVPHMVKLNHGHYMLIASSASYLAPVRLSAYSMSKAAALAFYEELRAELRAVYNAPRVRTSIVTPTKVRTLLGHGLKDSDNQFLNPALEPIQVADAMVNALNSGRSHYISQPAITRVLPLVRAAPEWLRALLNVVGKTDQLITDDSIRSSIKAGYGQNWVKGDNADLVKEMKGLVRMRGRAALTRQFGKEV
ncbi:hypothetical protein MSPP1_001757 [Malassezia sp. CBS 17886]|nr:hypothetical protein MSPP1_001757 [Malassezia sp. CBS 17886]